MKTPTHRQSRATALATVAFATLVFITTRAANRESWPQRIEADWLLASDVAQVSKSAGGAKANAARKVVRPAGLETGDTAGLETCATVAGSRGAGDPYRAQFAVDGRIPATA